MTVKKIFVAAALVMAIMIGALQSNVAEAAEEVSFEITSIHLESGKCEIAGIFNNNGDTPAHVAAVKFLGTINDSQGHLLYAVDFTADANSTNIGECVIPAHGQYGWIFTLTDARIPAYSGEINHAISWQVIWK